MNYEQAKSAPYIAVDIETKDPELTINGPGAVRGKGHIVGVSIAVPGGESEYIALRHEGGGNVPDINIAMQRLRYILSGDQVKIGANIGYDLEFLACSGVPVNCKKYCVQAIESLLDDNMESYSLDSLSNKYLHHGKDETSLVDEGLKYLGSGSGDLFGKTDKKDLKFIKNNLWKLPANIVDQYARIDAVNALQIYEMQQPLIKEQGLQRVVDLECTILDVLLAMRLQGIPVDIPAAEIAAEKMRTMYSELEARIVSICGFKPEIWAAASLKEVCKRLGYQAPKNFTTEFFETKNTPAVFNLIGQARKIDRAGAVYIESKIIDLAHNGRIYPQFWSTKSDAQGARHGTTSGRFASSNPNIQQVPSSDPLLAPMVRSIFVPEQNETWAMLDWSQQEPRLAVHFAAATRCRGAEEAAQRYRDNSSTDLHSLVAELAGVSRKEAKALFLGISYGMGRQRLADNLGITKGDADLLYDKIQTYAPFIKELSDRCKAVAQTRGYVRTLLGRRMRFDLWGPERASLCKPLPYDEAVKTYGRVERCFLYRAVNKVIQGSAADMMKIALVRLYQAGIVPYITMHDEVDFSYSDEKELKTAQEIMLTGYNLTVPLKIDTEVGKSWGELKLI
jgi:DNA polymerase I-like protein with 3'-5' exonuclease and polymerase domains